ncbi:flagellar basal body protein [Xanthomonas sp. PPL568]|uniref:flagellar basal body protein n=1 Tax=Xanthomonas indica TaxID=2912242 RepID=UPI001F5AEA2C|nr:flagellar basal body protein [Xanthomonas indica]MCI2244104.1 flagellar basal body protein [Xanthomonas indica]
MTAIAPSSSIALSGMRAATSGLQVRANNIANLATEGFQRSVPVNQATAGGVVGQVQQADGQGSDLVDDMVGTLTERTAFQANARVLRAADDSIGSLLDVLA